MQHTGAIWLISIHLSIHLFFYTCCTTQTGAYEGLDLAVVSVGCIFGVERCSWLDLGNGCSLFFGLFWCVCFFNVFFAGWGEGVICEHRWLKCDAGESFLFPCAGWWVFMKWLGWEEVSAVAQNWVPSRLRCEDCIPKKVRMNRNRINWIYT